MSDKTQQIQAVYSSSDVAATLKIQESTLRKYCLILEKIGYEFLKNENGHRAFFDADSIV
jgi:biotin operon repressor